MYFHAQELRPTILFLVLLIVACGKAKDVVGISTISSTPARSSCYSVPDPTLTGSCPIHLQQSMGSQSGPMSLGEDVVGTLRFDWTQLNNTNLNGTGSYSRLQGMNALNQLLNNTNGTSAWVNQTSLSWFFPRLDVFAQLTLNGSTTMTYLESRKASWEQVWLSFQLMHNGTIFSTEPKQWFTYTTDALGKAPSYGQDRTAATSDMDGLYLIPYRGVVVTLWKGTPF
jgi:hypothetical protein